MIAYEELAAALERWRIRNGLPGTPPLFADGARTSAAPAAQYAAPAAPYAAPVAYAAPAAPAAPYAAPAASYAPPAAARAPAAPPAAAPRTAPPSPPPSAETIDDDLADADVLDEDHLDNDGPDFAVGFDSGAHATAGRRPQAGMTSDDEREAAVLGGTDPGIVPPADAWPEAAAYSPNEATAATNYGWNQGNEPRPAAPVAPVADDDDDDDDGGTLVSG